MSARLAPLILLAACVAAPGTAQETERIQDDGFVAVELATVGLDVAGHTPVVLLRDGASGRIVPIWVGLSEAQAILRGLLGVEMPRPMTHDLLATLIRELGGEVQEVAIHDVRGGTYHAYVRLRMDGAAEVRDVDSRPSDAMALALRVGAPIRVAPPLLEAPPDFDFIAPEASEQVVRVLGLTVVVPTATLTEQFSTPDEPGLLVVGSYGEAAEKGLRRGDFILHVNGIVPYSPMDLFDAVNQAEDSVDLVVWRDGETHQVTLEPVTRSAPREQQRRPAPIRT